MKPGELEWGAIPGLLKVYTGAHEVIITIMLNYIAALFAGWTVYAGGTQGQTPGPLWDPTAGAISETPDVLATAQIPWIFGPPYRVHYGLFIALAAMIFGNWALSDQIAVIYRSKIVNIVPREAATRADLGLLMAGARL